MTVHDKASAPDLLGSNNRTGEKSRRSERAALDQELRADISIVRTFSNPGSPDTEWAAICEGENGIWYVEQLESQIRDQPYYVVSQGSHNDREGYSRGRLLCTCSSLDVASAVINIR